MWPSRTGKRIIAIIGIQPKKYTGGERSSKEGTIRMAGKTKGINNIVVVSDTHCGCKLALCPPSVVLDEGGEYHQSNLQKQLWEHWQFFWQEWVPEATRGEPFAVVHNGDAIDGVHHNSTTQISHNLTDQRRIAYEVMRPVVELCEGRYYHVRGTEAHVGKSAQEEEALAKELGARPNEEGNYARYDLWIRCGEFLAHCLHHVGTTGSNAYEATAVHKELTEELTEAARWQEQPPDCIVRSHRHRYVETSIPTRRARAIAVVTPAWQAKTPFAWKIPGARLAPPQFGGILLRTAHGRLFVDSKVWTPERSKPE